MKDFLAKNRGRLIAALFIIALLTAAWFYGDGSSTKNKKDNSVPADFAGADYTLSENSAENPTEETSTPKQSAEEQGGLQNKPGRWSEGPDEGNTSTPTITSGEKIAEKTPTETPTEVIPTEKPVEASSNSKGSTPTPTAIPTPTLTPTVAPTITPTLTPTPTPEPEGKYTCTISIDCKTIIPKLKDMNPKLRKLIPEDGVILSGETVYFNEGDSVFDVLKRVCLELDISLEYSYVPAFKTVYIEGLADLYEFDGGNLSGWQYSVNGEYVMLGCSAKTVSDGDVIEWRYTCDMGRDL